MSKVFKVLSIFALALSLAPTFVHAQTQPKNPEVTVQGLYVQEPRVKEGSVLQGAFRLVNQDAVPYSGIKYVLVLSRYDDSHSPIESLDDKTYGPVLLKPKESKLIPFTYSLPRGIAGNDLGIRIVAVTESGYKMGWDDAEFQITGNTASALNLIDAFVTVGGVEYNLVEGPTAYPSDSASYKATISNPTNAAVILVPTIEFYRKDVSGKFMTKTMAPAIKIDAKSQSQFIFPLPVTFDPEVYVGKVSFSDEKGVIRVPLTTFRYIVGGDIVTIQSVTSASVGTQSGQVVDLKIAYTGTPVDIATTTSQHVVGNALLSVKLYNENNDVIGSAEAASEFAYTGEKNISVKTTGPARSLRAVVLVTKDGRTLGSSNAVLSLSEEAAPVVTVSYVDVLIVIFGFGIAIILFILWKLHQKNTPPSSPAPSSMPMAPLVVMVLTLLSGLLAVSHKTYAFTATDSHNENSTIFGPEFGQNVDWRPSVAVYFKDENNKSVSNNTLAPGQKFYVTATAVNLACQNQADNVGYQIKYLDGGSWQAMGTTTEGSGTARHGTTAYTHNLKCDWGTKGSCVIEGANKLKGDAFVAPMTPGTYKMYFYVFNDPQINLMHYPKRGSAAFIPVNNDADKWVDNEVNFGWVSGYEEFTVADNTPRGDVKIESVDLAGNPYLAHHPRYISHMWGDQTQASYLSSPAFPPSKAAFNGLVADAQYSTSLDANFPGGHTDAALYRDVGIPNVSRASSGDTVASRISSGFKNIMSFFLQPASAQTTIGTPASCSRTIPTDVQVGVCLYDRGGTECTPTNFFDLQARSLPSDPTCKADLFYPFDVQGNKVTKIVYRFGETAPVEPTPDPVPKPGTLSASCNATVQIPGGGVEDPATQAAINQNVTWGATVSGGDGQYTYTWTGTDLPDGIGITTTDPTFIKAYDRLGKKTVSLRVTDGHGATSELKVCTVSGVVVKVNPTWGEN